MMKACHVEEAHMLLKELNLLDNKIAHLNDAENVSILWSNYHRLDVNVNDPKFGDLRQALLVILNNQRANLVRRANQIGLLIEPVVVPTNT